MKGIYAQTPYTRLFSVRSRRRLQKRNARIHALHSERTKSKFKVSSSG